MKHNLESRLLGEISITSYMQITPPLWQKARGTKEPLDESERGEWNSQLKIQHSNNDHGIWSHYFMANNGETMERVRGFIFLGSKKSLQMVTVATKLKDDCSWKKSYEQHRQHVKKQRHYFAKKGPSTQSYGFSSSHVWMWEVHVWLTAEELMFLNCGVWC